MMRYFLDTEFIEDGRTIDLISIGIVSEDGRELYLQNADCDFTKANDWVARHVFPHLQDFDMGRRERSCVEWTTRSSTPIGKGGSCIGDSCVWRHKVALGSAIEQFTMFNNHGQRDTTPEFWGYYAGYDWVVLCQLFGAMVRLPSGWPMLVYDLRQYLNFLGMERVKQSGAALHHALEDARWVATAWRAYNKQLSLEGVK